MLIKELEIKSQANFMTDYQNNKEEMQLFFDYKYKDKQDFMKRQQELKNRLFQREELVKHLISYNKTFQCSQETITNIEKLEDEKSVVVVGGQQAGILTGPLYTIHKIITILKQAKEYEELLKVSVVPVFWVAGEDHDFDEINHLFQIKSNKLQKHVVNQKNSRKQSVSNLKLNKDAVKTFVNRLFFELKETVYTPLLVSEIDNMIELSETYSDFFSLFIHKLFQGSGIVLLDSHHPELRKIEAIYFKQMINDNELLNKCFLQTATLFNDHGYGEPIERTPRNAHLFYHHDGKRILLEWNNYSFTDKQNTISFTKDELLQMVDEQPENFSNNVVTRPLMQELLLPVIAFVGGPGEIAYWGLLKEVFHLFGCKVPPIIPRFSITFIDKKIEKLLQKEEVAIAELLVDKKIAARQNLLFWEEQQKIEQKIVIALQQLEQIHLPLKELAKETNRGLEKLAEKNEAILKKELQFLARQIEKSVRQKYEQQWLNFDVLEHTFIPNGGLQERSLNIVPYLNEYGFEFVHQLLELSYEMNDRHKLIYLN